MSGISVLIVDDSNMMRSMLGSTLRNGGYEVTECASGPLGLKEAEKQLFSLVITDFNMPVMSGADVVRELRAMAAYQSVPILVLTTEMEESAKQKARVAGATGWMCKPFEPTKLLDVVKRVTG